ncbi:hypothetical protein GCM10009629_57240 [Pseudonocardia alni]
MSCSELDRLPSGSLVSMRCWEDTKAPELDGVPLYGPSPRWFYVTEAEGGNFPGGSGYLYSAFVPPSEQVQTEKCSADIIKKFPAIVPRETVTPPISSEISPDPPVVPGAGGNTAASSPNVPTQSGAAASPSSAAPPSPNVEIRVSNLVTSGMNMREDSKPAYLSSEPRNYCCKIAGTEVVSGGVLTASCHVTGERTTNGNDTDPVDDSNAGRFESSRWYFAVNSSGSKGYLSEVWTSAASRGGLGLPIC